MNKIKKRLLALIVVIVLMPNLSQAARLISINNKETKEVEEVKEIEIRENEVEEKKEERKMVVFGGANRKQKEVKKEQPKKRRIIRKQPKKVVEEVKKVNKGPIAPINLKDPGVRISSHYGPRKAPIAGASTFHRGIDIAAPRGTHIYAPLDGTVTFVKGANGGAGNMIRIKHADGIETTYMHMSKRSVRQGETIKKGDVVGTVGTTGNSTGNHLHFETKINGKHVNPIQVLGCSLGICK